MGKEKFINDLFFMNNNWKRWELLAVLLDFVLSFTEGDMVEIGVGETSAIFTALSKKYRRKVYHCDLNRNRVKEHLKHKRYFGDMKNLIFVGYSDDFFKRINLPPIAVGFIDGGHMHDQAKRDFDNLFSLVVEDGYIFLHDTYPSKELHVEERFCGTSYLLRQELENNPMVDCFTFTNSSNNHGLTMVRKKPKDRPYYQE